MFEQPLRALVDPRRDPPVATDSRGRARRWSHWYPCAVPARMRIGANEHDVRCVDVGYGGVCVLADSQVRPAEGQEALVTSQTESGLYGDNLIVVDTEPAPQGTYVRLKLSDLDSPQ